MGTGQLLRSLSLLSLVNALAEKLRGVFVPYFGLLLDVCVAHLSGEWVWGGGMPIGGGDCRSMQLAWLSTRADSRVCACSCRGACIKLRMPDRAPYLPPAADSSVAAAGKKSKKKKRKSEGAVPEDGQAAPSPADDPLYVEHHWRLRLKVGMWRLFGLPARPPGGSGSCRDCPPARKKVWDGRGPR